MWLIFLKKSSIYFTSFFKTYVPIFFKEKNRHICASLSQKGFKGAKPLARTMKWYNGLYHNDELLTKLIWKIYNVAGRDYDTTSI